MTETGWERVGEVAPAELVAARLELHHAAQLAAAVGASLLEPRADDSQPNLGWHGSGRAFVGHVVSAKRPFAAALRPEDLTLALVDETGAPIVEVGLVGRGPEDGLGWLERETRVLGARAREGGIRVPGYELPANPVTDAAVFSDDLHTERRELVRWYAGAHRVLAAMTRSDADASSVRVWPHHFDIATLITLSRDASGATERSVGVGLSPGDESYAEPYWYVSPWPHPEASGLPALAGAGHWHVSGFTAAILTGADIAAAGDARAQSTCIDGFLSEAVAASRRLLAR